jgi:hypothetical protein
MRGFKFKCRIQNKIEMQNGKKENNKEAAPGPLLP